MFGLGPIELLVVMVIGVVSLAFLAVVFEAALKILRSPHPHDDHEKQSNAPRS